MGRQLRKQPKVDADKHRWKSEYITHIMEALINRCRYDITHGDSTRHAADDAAANDPASSSRETQRGKCISQIDDINVKRREHLFFLMNKPLQNFKNLLILLIENNYHEVARQLIPFQITLEWRSKNGNTPLLKCVGIDDTDPKWRPVGSKAGAPAPELWRRFRTMSDLIDAEFDPSLAIPPKGGDVTDKFFGRAPGVYDANRYVDAIDEDGNVLRSTPPGKAPWANELMRQSESKPRDIQYPPRGWDIVGYHHGEPLYDIFLRDYCGIGRDTDTNKFWPVPWAFNALRGANVNEKNDELRTPLMTALAREYYDKMGDDKQTQRPFDPSKMRDKLGRLREDIEKNYTHAPFYEELLYNRKALYKEKDIHGVDCVTIVAGLRKFEYCGSDIRIPLYAHPHVDILRNLMGTGKKGQLPEKQPDEHGHLSYALAFTTDFNGTTPLIRAATWGFIDTIKALLDKNNSVKHRDYANKYGMNALQMAQRYGNTNVVKIFQPGPQAYRPGSYTALESEVPTSTVLPKTESRDSTDVKDDGDLKDEAYS